MDCLLNKCLKPWDCCEEQWRWKCCVSKKVDWRVTKNSVLKQCMSINEKSVSKVSPSKIVFKLAITM